MHLKKNLDIQPLKRVKIICENNGSRVYRIYCFTCQNSWGKSPCADKVLRSVNCSSSEDDSPSSVVESSELGDVARLLILTARDDL